VLHPNRCMGPESNLAQVLTSDYLQPLTEVDASLTGNPNEVKAEILSGKYRLVIVADLSLDQRWFTAQFRSCLRAFVTGGGAIAFLQFAIPVLCPARVVQDVIRPIFRFDWRQGKMVMDPSIVYFTDNHMAKNWFPKSGKKIQSSFAYATNVEEKNIIYKGEEGDAGFALRKYGDGLVAYFGDFANNQMSFWSITQFFSLARDFRRMPWGKKGFVDVFGEPVVQCWVGTNLDNSKEVKRLAAQHNPILEVTSACYAFYYDDFSGLPVVFAPLDGYDISIPCEKHDRDILKNRAELESVVMALSLARKYDRRRIRLSIDSDYVRELYLLGFENLRKYVSEKQYLKMFKTKMGCVGPKLAKQLVSLMEIMKIEWIFGRQPETSLACSWARNGSKAFLQTINNSKFKSDYHQLLQFNRKRGTDIDMMVVRNIDRVLIGRGKELSVKVPITNFQGKEKVYILPHDRACGMIIPKPTCLTIDNKSIFSVPFACGLVAHFQEKLVAERQVKLMLHPGSIVAFAITSQDRKATIDDNIWFSDIVYMVQHHNWPSNDFHILDKDEDLTIISRNWRFYTTDIWSYGKMVDDADVEGVPPEESENQNVSWRYEMIESLVFPVAFSPKPSLVNKEHAKMVPGSNIMHIKSLNPPKAFVERCNKLEEEQCSNITYLNKEIDSFCCPHGITLRKDNAVEEEGEDSTRHEEFMKKFVDLLKRTDNKKHFDYMSDKAPLADLMMEFFNHGDDDDDDDCDSN